MQFDFTGAILKLAKAQGIHTAIETSGFSGRDLTRLHPYTDLWLYDIKLFPDAAHRKYTGVSNKMIFDNLYLLNSMGANIILRCPIIPGVNLTEQHFLDLAELSGSLRNIAAIHLEPYHPLGLSKALRLNKNQAYPNDKFLEPSRLEPFAELLRAKTDKEVIII